MAEQEIRDKYKVKMDRVVRWDSYRINQFSYTNNLLIGLNLAFLGFFINQSGFKVSCNCYFITLQLLTGLLLSVSFIIGLVTVLNRLQDFRKTAELTKRRKKKFEHDYNLKSHTEIEVIDSDIRTLKSETEKLGTMTWILLRLQIWTFLIGTMFGVVYLIVEKNVCG